MLLAAFVAPFAGASERSLPPQPVARQQIALPVENGTLELRLEPDIPNLLVRIDSHGASVRSRIRDAEGRTHSAIALDYLRSAPVWHVVSRTGDRGSPPHLEIDVIRVARGARLEVAQFALENKSSDGQSRLAAWVSLARGLQQVEGEDPRTWAPILAALDQARSAFERLGMAEPALWAGYFKAYFEYYPLYRYSEALAAVDTLAARVDRAQLPRLRLLIHQLSGQIRIEREADADENEAWENYRIAQQEFEHALELARATENDFEVIWALNNSGITFHYQDRPERAMEAYGYALDLAIQLEDGYLVDLIGTNMAVAQEKLGYIEESIGTLNRMLASLDPDENPQETEHVLNLLGSYFLKLYRFPEALDVLSRAIELSARQGRTESLGRNRLSLAQAYRELGQAEQAMLHLQLAIPDLERSRNGRGLRRAHALSADLHRQAQRFEAMQEARTRQEQFLATDADRAEWLAGHARDSEAAGAMDEAITLYRQSADRFETTPFSELGMLARLRACVLAAETRPQPGCATEDIQPASDRLIAVQASVPGLEARYLWGRLQALENAPVAAIETMRQLIAETQFLRQSLPGVLGAWYWDARRDIFDFYMDLELRPSSDPHQAAASSLAALLWLRSAGDTASGPAAAPQDDGFATQARILLAQRQQAETAEDTARAQRLIDQHLLAHRPPLSPIPEPLSPADIERQWRALPAGWSVLTYYAAPHQVYAWTADRNGLRRHALGAANALPEQLTQLKDNLRALHYPQLDSELAEWGRRLIEPLQAELRDKLIFIGSGAFSDFPIEALHLDGKPLLHRHTVMNLVSGFNLEGAIHRLQSVLAPSRLFLAGNPTELDPGQNRLPGSAAELEIVRRVFPAAAVTRLEGKDLTLAGIGQPAFEEAGLVHIASHALIDRAYPEFSSIRLSGFDTHGPERLTPADLGQRRLTAQLVVLSACSTVGLNRFEFDTHLGFVSSFLQHGSDHVLASLRPIPDRATVTLMELFYQLAAEGIDLPSALRQAKIAASAGGVAPGRWSAFQLFSR